MKHILLESEVTDIQETYQPTYCNLNVSEKYLVTNPVESNCSTCLKTFNRQNTA